LSKTISLGSLGTLQTKFLHPLDTATRSWFALCLLFGRFATVLAPELLLSLLALFLEADDNVDSTTDMLPVVCKLRESIRADNAGG
jgi:hypothetical protein